MATQLQKINLDPCSNPPIFHTSFIEILIERMLTCGISCWKAILLCSQDIPLHSNKLNEFSVEWFDHHLSIFFPALLPSTAVQKSWHTTVTQEKCYSKSSIFMFHLEKLLSDTKKAKATYIWEGDGTNLRWKLGAGFMLFILIQPLLLVSSSVSTQCPPVSKKNIGILPG